MARSTILIAVTVSLIACATTPRETGFLNRSVSIGGSSYPYVVYVPRDWTPDRQWPVILFLHGAGERGHDGLKPTQVGLGSLLRSAPDRVPAIVVFPQAPEEQRWMGQPADAAIHALDRSIEEFSGDPQRIYLTGLSLGGYGVWHFALAYPNRFAALVPICGGIVPAGSATSVRQSPLTLDAADPHAYVATQLRTIPTWIFHGAEDTVVLPSESRQMHDTLRAAAGIVRYTEYEGVGHNSWDRAYGESELWAWLFNQRNARMK